MGYPYYDSGYTPPPPPPAFINPPPFKLKKKGNPDAAPTIQDPNEEPEAEALPYNPFRYSYRLPLNELSIDIWVQFKLDTYDYKNKGDLVYKDEEGIERRVPFFPLPRPGTDPGYTENQTFTSVYREGEKQLVVYPSIVKAESYGDKGRLNITQQAVLLAVSPERLETALVDFYSHCRRDPQCPVPLLILLKDVCQGMNTWSPEVEAAGADQNPSFHEQFIEAVFNPPPPPPQPQSDLTFVVEPRGNGDDVEEDEFDEEDWQDDWDDDGEDDV